MSNGTITVTLLVCDKPTPQTGHIFPTEQVREAVEKYVDGGMRLGTSNIDQLDNLPLDSFSHKVHKMWMDDNKVMAEISMIDTPQGELILDAMRAGVPIRFAPAGNFVNLIDKTVVDFTIQHTVSYIGEKEK